MKEADGDILKQADEAGLLDHAKKWQWIDISEVQNRFTLMSNKEDRMNYLSEEYPSLYVLILELLGQQDKI